MHITLETDYAVRIVDCLAHNGGKLGAKAISETACVTLRFSLKILRKLVATGIVRSYKGAQGGYEIAKPLSEISINDIVETIEGPYTLNRCMYQDFECTRTADKRCPYHYLFAHISDQVQEQLKQVTLSNVIQNPPLHPLATSAVSTD